MKPTFSLIKPLILTLLIGATLTPAVSAGDGSRDSKSLMMAETPSTDRSFAKKKYKIKGHYSIETRDGHTVLRLSEDFKTKSGPDLKIFLSPLTTDAVTGANATQGSVPLGALKTNKGGSEYILPEGLDLSLYSSVLIHCEAYSVLWGAASL